MNSRQRFVGNGLPPGPRQGHSPGMWYHLRPGMVNFLFDASQTPHIPASQIREYFGLSSSTTQAKSRQVLDLLHIALLDPDWTLPSLVDQNPLIWLLEVNGLIIDARSAPRELA